MKCWKLVKEPCLFLLKMTTGILSIFHGPRIESSFNVMGSIIDKKAGRINLETYSAIQGIKYVLKARHPLEQNWCVKEFHREIRHYMPINPTLTRNMRSSFYLFNVNRKQTKRNQSSDDRNLI